MRHFKFFIGFFALAFIACSTTPEVTAPPWTQGQARTVDNGYIVYLGSAEDVTPERAQFLAEGMALQDLANECSFAPKGTRVEDRFVEKQKNTYKAYAKVGLEMQVCDEARKAVNPDEIKNLASAGFAEEIKKYQDAVEGGAPELVADGADVDMPEAPPAGGGGGGSGGGYAQVHFFAVRQYVAYQKEVVILAPASSFPPQAPQTAAFVNNVTTASTQVGNYEREHPEVRKSPAAWSRLENRPLLPRRNSAFSRGSQPVHEVRPPSGYGRQMGRGQPKNSAPRGGGRRRRRRFDENP